VDPTLSRFAADIGGLATQGVVVQRATLAQVPGKFAAKAAVHNALVEKGTGVLLAIVDGVLKSTGAYPAREQIATSAGLNQAKAPAAVPIVNVTVPMSPAIAGWVPQIPVTAVGLRQFTTRRAGGGRQT
jgi:Arsenical resistance operon protein ArsD